MESVDYGKALDWDDEVEYSEPEFTLLPPGDYNFTVTGFEREHYPGGQKLPACDKAVFFITIEVPEGKTTIKHNFFMLEYMKGYLHQFFVSIGQFKPRESGRPKWNATVGSKGRCQTNTLSQAIRHKNGKVKDLTGQKFGFLEVVQKASKRSGTNPMWECLCTCGNRTTVIQENLLNGHTQSCGCMRFDIGSQTLTHGLSNTRLYHVWRGMIARCEYPSQDSYPLYGGRGISVCEEWRNNFMSFYNWAMNTGYDTEAPFGKCTIDRIDVNGNYEPANCRWVDMVIQAKNKRNR